MRGAYNQLYLHFVWGTWHREALITPELQPHLYASIAHHSVELGADVIAIGGMPDHVHLLVRFPTTISASEFMRRVKGGSSHLVTQVMCWPEPFKWQGGYGVFSVSKRNLPAAKAYVLNQERHHADGAVHAALERMTG